MGFFGSLAGALYAESDPPHFHIAEVCERTFFENCPRLGPLYSRLVERPRTSNSEAGSLLLLYRFLPILTKKLCSILVDLRLR